MSRSVIILVGHNSPFFPTHEAKAIMSIDSVWYEYEDFSYHKFLKLNQRKPGLMLNWLKKNAKTTRKVEW